jgi:hypothetical protein
MDAGADDPEPPKEPSVDEQRERVLRTYGSKPVGDAYDEFAEAVRSFFYDAMGLRETREVNRPDIAEPWEGVEASRSTVRAALAKIERLVSDELAALSFDPGGPASGQNPVGIVVHGCVRRRAGVSSDGRAEVAAARASPNGLGRRRGSTHSVGV